MSITVAINKREQRTCSRVLTWREWHDLPLDVQMSRAPDQLILPHPRIQDRPFVLVPLRDVAPDWVHPVLGMGVNEMLDRCDCDEIAGVVPLDA